MLEWLFKKKHRSQLGIDLGSSVIKIVELAKKEGRIHLVNYAIAKDKDDTFNFAEIRNEDIASILKNLIAEAKFESKLASFSLPIDKTFSTVMEMPIMAEEEMVAAIPYEAQKYVPVPIEEVVLDWTVIPSASALSEKPAAGEEITDKNKPEIAPKKSLQILLVAVPKEIIDNLTRIAKLAGLEVAALEQEAFSLTRALIGNDNGVYLVANFGRRSTDLLIVDQGIIRISHSLEAASKEIILMEMDRLVNIYQMRYTKKVNQCLMSGGRANEKETIDFLAGKLKIPVKLGDPLARVGHLPVLDSIAKELGSQLAIAIGLAMREN